MLKLAANLDWIFKDLPISARFHAARQAGFHGVEGLFLWQHPLAELRLAQQETELPVVLLNAPAGNWSAGERGLASLPLRDDEYRASLSLAREYASALGCRQVHVMAGNRSAALSAGQQQALLVSRLQYACDFMAPAGITVLIEPLNPQDMPNYFIDNFPLAEKIMTQVARENIGLQFDIYHCQKTHGDVARNIAHYWPLIRHFQIASVPGRNEPGTGELNDAWLLNYIQELNYRGWIGCEYTPLNSPANWITTTL